MEYIMNYIDKEIVWAKGRSKSEDPKYTTWAGAGGGDNKLGGFSVSTYNHNEFVGVTPHASDGRCWSKYFQIPLDSVVDFCDALIEARDFCLQHQHK